MSVKKTSKHTLNMRQVCSHGGLGVMQLVGLDGHARGLAGFSIHHLLSPKNFLLLNDLRYCHLLKCRKNGSNRLDLLLGMSRLHMVEEVQPQMSS
jgi:hypothetical protein